MGGEVHNRLNAAGPSASMRLSRAMVNLWVLHCIAVQCMQGTGQHMTVNPTHLVCTFTGSCKGTWQHMMVNLRVNLTHAAKGSYVLVDVTMAQPVYCPVLCSVSCRLAPCAADWLSV
jgi:hypothetical protein